jgi:hypothetical protein
MIYSMKLKKLVIISEAFRLKGEISTNKMSRFLTSL